MPAALSALHGALAVAAGAFAAHAAPDARAEALLDTGARWQAIAALAGLLAASRGVRSAAWLFVGGAGVFAGSLYAMAAGAPSGLGLATPFGGGALIAGWAVLAWAWARDAR
ncbi:MAG: DUF423 domain-containing protein [Caulobacterales bacterium]|nr:DUF423 domain-containing protein [Caulobacterales bacterium]